MIFCFGIKRRTYTRVYRFNKAVPDPMITSIQRQHDTATAKTTKDIPIVIQLKLYP